MKQYLLPLKILVAVTLFVAIFLSLDWQLALQKLTRIHWGWLLAGIASHVCALTLSAWRWQRLVNALNHQLSYGNAVHFYWIGSLFSTVLPSNIGGDVVRLALARRIGSITDILSSVLMERITGFLVLLTVGAIALLSFPESEQVIPMRTPLIAILLGCLCAVPVLIVRGSGLFNRFVERHRSRRDLAGKLLSKLGQLNHSIQQYRHRRRELAITLILSVIFYGILFAYQGWMVLAVGGELTLAGLVFAAPLVILVSSLPISFNGLGVSEGAFVVLYTLAGVDPETALAAALLRRLCITFVASLGVIPWLRERQQTPQ